MDRVGSLKTLVASLLLPLIACAPTAGPTDGAGGVSSDSARQVPQRTLAIAVRGEPPSLALKALVAYGRSLRGSLPLFNGTLDWLDERGVANPYLAEAVPQLNSDTWRVFTDGRMETTYRLKPNLTWQDGASLSGEDFVFAWRVYSTPQLGHAASPPMRFIEEVIAPDPRTVVIRWREPFAEADLLDDTFQALPRHILQGPFQDLDPLAFSHLPFWSQDYVGWGLTDSSDGSRARSSKGGRSTATRWEGPVSTG